MENSDELKERYNKILNYCQYHRLGGGINSGELNGYIEGAVEDLQTLIGKENAGKLIFKFMVEYFDPRDYPRDYKWLLYYNKDNLSKLIKSASHEESDDDIFGYEPAKIATEDEIRDNYNSTLNRFVNDYKNFKNQKEPLFDIYTSFTSEPNKIDFDYFLGKGVCKRVLVSRATDQNIFINNLLGMQEYEVIDVVTQGSFIEILLFEDWLIKYPEYSKGFEEYLKNHSRNIVLPTPSLSELTEEELEIRSIMDRIIEGI
ncbi:hypothetical protein IL308_13080 [Lactococcus lactis]|uniref:hypothetical protein n=1 Tax=Lactococcus lactis TaxID=1358 RepID=UPI0019146FD3|nr:hypothetical protein [Lactococcus lactis]MBK5077669.1 hypothetical protein [Lactococcus lactis]